MKRWTALTMLSDCHQHFLSSALLATNARRYLVEVPRFARTTDGCCSHQPFPWQRKPLPKSRSEKWPTLSAQCARNSLSQWPTRATTTANLRKSRHNSAIDIFSCNIRDLLAERESCQPRWYNVGFSRRQIESYGSSYGISATGGFWLPIAGKPNLPTMSLCLIQARGFDAPVATGRLATGSGWGSGDDMTDKPTGPPACIALRESGRCCHVRWVRLGF